LPIYRIAETLGFSETASFRHAFVRWSGVAPSQFRAARLELTGMRSTPPDLCTRCAASQLDVPA
jgi:AraC-like DNA-binding protein